MTTQVRVQEIREHATGVNVGVLASCAGGHRGLGPENMHRCTLRF